MNVLQKLLFNLQTIASIPSGKRISTAKEFIIIDEDSVLQGFWRWKAADSRDKAVQAICSEVRTTVAIALLTMESYHLFVELPPAEPSPDSCDIPVSGNKSMSKREERISELKTIRNALIETNFGIDNICQTYIIDADVLGHIKPLIGEVNDCVTAITQKLIELGEYTIEPARMIKRAQHK